MNKGIMVQHMWKKRIQKVSLNSLEKTSNKPKPTSIKARLGIIMPCGIKLNVMI